MKTRYIVIGSINIDLNVTVERLPQPGETVTGKGFSTAFGGKGANQAVALARLRSARDYAQNKAGMNIILAGKTGTDDGGNRYLEYFAQRGIDISLIEKSNQPTGTALIEIDQSGTNRIVVVPGANGDITLDWWNSTKARLGDLSDAIVLFQLELPITVVTRAIADVHAAGGFTILDPAPAAKIPDALWESVDVVTPNQTETAFYTGIKPNSDEEARLAAKILRSHGIRNVIIKAGGKGSWFFGDDEAWFCPVFPVRVVDTTAAGDSFNAGFAHAIGGGMPYSEALRYANAVGGLSTTAAGAQTAMPDSDTVEELLRASPRIVPRRL
jgi:ribokinase